MTTPSLLLRVRPPVFSPSDQLRGLCLVIMTIDHVGLFPSVLDVITGQSGCG